jgi:hypothetical protein
MTAPVPESQPAWYHDPYDARWLRWWNGHAWTEHLQPVPYGVSVHEQHRDAEMRWVLPVGRPGSAIAAGYLGLFSLMPNPITALPALICGLVALRTLDARPDLVGRGRAWLGIVAGGLNVALFTFLFGAAILT